MTPEEQEQEREDVRRRTEENRKKIPETVLKLLAERNVTLDDILKMDRQEFREVNFFLADHVSTEDRDTIIRFKNHSMTFRELSEYDVMTNEEMLEVARDDEEFRKTLLEDLDFPYREELLSMKP